MNKIVTKNTRYIEQLRTFLYEESLNLHGKKIRHVRSALFFWSALLFFIFGVVLLIQNLKIGAFFLLTLVPCLLLYPFVRILIGGKDSVFGVVLTFVIEEVLKHKLKNSSDRNKKR